MHDATISPEILVIESQLHALDLLNRFPPLITDLYHIDIWLNWEKKTRPITRSPPPLRLIQRVTPLPLQSITHTRRSHALTAACLSSPDVMETLQFKHNSWTELDHLVRWQLGMRQDRVLASRCLRSNLKKSKTKNLVKPLMLETQCSWLCLWNTPTEMQPNCDQNKRHYGPE